LQGASRRYATGPRFLADASSRLQRLDPSGINPWRNTQTR